MAKSDPDGPVVVDASAWVEYGDGSPAGEIAREYIEGTGPLYTPSVVVAELSDRATRLDRRADWQDVLFPFIRRHSTIVALDADLADRAGTLKWMMREGSPDASLADAIVLAVAQNTDASVLTSDRDFIGSEISTPVIDITVK